MIKRFLAALAATSFSLAHAGAAPIAFTSCPIVRDTSTVGCWLTQYKGELYYLGLSVDQSAPFDPPSLGHQALIEGVITDKPRVCGGIPIDPVHVSVLEPDPRCNQFLPADPRFELGFKPPRGPGPRDKRQGASEAGGLGLAEAARPAAQPASETREFVVTYDFDNERAGLSTRVMAQAMQYANAIHARRVEITAYRASVLLEDGKRLVEKPFIAERRANTLAETMAEIGVPAETIAVKWVATPTRAKGKGLDSANRKATIVVIP